MWLCLLPKKSIKREVVPHLMETFGYRNVMQVPKVEKIVINMGVGDATQNSRYLDLAVEELALISGQKPVVTRAKNPYLILSCGGEHPLVVKLP